MQVYIGIDWSESKHDVVAMNAAGAVLAQLTIPHSIEGFLQLTDLQEKLGITNLPVKHGWISCRMKWNSGRYILNIGAFFSHCFRPNREAKATFFSCGVKDSKVCAPVSSAGLTIVSLPCR